MAHIFNLLPPTDQNVTLERIEIGSPPNKVVYNVGESFSTEGMTVIAYYDNGMSGPITGYTYEPSTISLGTSEIVISYSDGFTIKSTSVSINVELIETEIPVISGTLTYNGTKQSPSFLHYDSTKMSMTGDIDAVNAGSYSITFELRQGYKWTDGTTTTKKLNWEIKKANAGLSVSSNSLVIAENSSTISMTIYKSSDGAISIFSNNTSIATVTLSGSTATIRKRSVGSTSIVVSVSETNNYNSASLTVNVKVEGYILARSYTSAGTFTYYPSGNYVSVIIIGGGGGGGKGGDGAISPGSEYTKTSGGSAGAGGGKGETQKKENISVVKGQAYNIVVGEGGTGGTDTVYAASLAKAGGSSSAFGYVAQGGGAGNPGVDGSYTQYSITRIGGKGAGGNGGNGGSSTSNAGTNGSTGSYTSVSLKDSSFTVEDGSGGGGGGYGDYMTDIKGSSGSGGSTNYGAGKGGNGIAGYYAGNAGKGGNATSYGSGGGGGGGGGGIPNHNYTQSLGGNGGNGKCGCVIIYEKG